MKFLKINSIKILSDGSVYFSDSNNLIVPIIEVFEKDIKSFYIYKKQQQQKFSKSNNFSKYRRKLI